MSVNNNLSFDLSRLDEKGVLSMVNQRNQDILRIGSAVDFNDELVINPEWEFDDELDIDAKEDLEDEIEEPEKTVTWERIRKPVHHPKRAKASFERSADVQRWLHQEGIAQVDPKPAFNPTFLAGQRDAPWILSSLTPLYDQNLITDILHVVQSGKEANVFCCAAHPSTGAEYLAVKVYRPRMFRSLKNDTDYRMNRTQRDEQGRVVHGSSRMRGVARKTERGRAVRVSSWIMYEFEVQRALYNAGIHVPKPYAQIGNAVLMEYIGEVGNAAPRLRDVRLEPEETRLLFERVMADIEKSLAAGRIHGDLSEYNILYWQGDVVIIDLAQAVDTCYDETFPIFARDVERVCQYFAQYGIQEDAYALANAMWVRQLGGVE